MVWRDRREGRERRRRDDDYWYGFPEFPFRSFSGFDSFERIFREFDEEFEQMRGYMNEIIRRSMQGELPSPEEGGPYVYGFTMRVGPEGRPQIHEFGNIPGLMRTGKLGGTGKPELGSAAREPLTDVIEDESHYSITMEMPGINKQDIELEVTENGMVVDVESGNRKYHKEITFDSPVKPDSGTATYNNGILEIKVEKERPTKGRGKKLKID